MQLFMRRSAMLRLLLAALVGLIAVPGYTQGAAQAPANTLTVRAPLAHSTPRPERFR